MVDYVVNYKPNLMFLHFLYIDEAGHESSWGSHQYYSAVAVYTTSLLTGSLFVLMLIRVSIHSLLIGILEIY